MDFLVTQKQSAKYSGKGLTLLEVMLSMLIFTIVALGLSRFMIHSKFMAENNLYEATALNVALSTIEQLQSEPYNTIEALMAGANPADYTLDLINGESAIIKVNDGDIPAPETSSELSVPVTDSTTGETLKDIEVKLTATLTADSSIEAYWITVAYSYTHPRDDRVLGGMVRSFIHNVPNVSFLSRKVLESTLNSNRPQPTTDPTD